MPTTPQALLIIFTVAITTLFTRAFPFLLFGRKGQQPPRFIIYLVAVLPPAVMAMLVVFCLKSVDLLAYPYGLPELIASITVVALHAWKKNTMLSILVGTVFYMLLVQFVFTTA